jgi:hypothetical protein
MPMRAIAVAFLLSVPLAVPNAAAWAQAPSRNLPAPDLPEGATVTDYLRAAQGAVAAGRLREAENALEMAQTRMLDRSVPLFQTQNPSDNPTIVQITQARQALSAGDRSGALQLIGAAIGSASSQGL